MPQMQGSFLESEKGSQEGETKEEKKKRKQKEAGVRYLLKHPERRRATYQKYRKAHPEKHRRASHKYYWKEVDARRHYSRIRYYKNHEFSKAQGRRWYAANKKIINEKSRKTFQRMRIETFLRYGGLICKCCGETGMDFLSIDHVNGRGNEHRKEIGVGSSSILRWLKRNNYPQGFQVLCFLCNFAKGKLGTCPHQQMKTPIDLFFEQLQ